MFKRTAFAGISLLLSVITLFAVCPVAAAEETEIMNILGFESGTKQGFNGRGETEFLSVSNAEAYEGNNSLSVSDRSQPWHGPSLSVAYYVSPGVLYDVSVWVKSASESVFRLGVQAGEQYFTVNEQTVSGEWTQLAGKIEGTEDEIFAIYVECDSADTDFYIDNAAFRPAGAGNLQKSIELPSLREIYKDDFLIGTAFTPSDLEGDRYELIKRHFNVMTAGNEMKPQSLSPSANNYRYAHIDSALETLINDGFLIHGHTLVWHSQSADWLNLNADDEPLTRAEAKANMEAYINEVAGHFKGKVISWDVVNEAISTNVGANPSDWKDHLREGDAPWYRAYENGADTAAGESGADYIYDAFVFARLADPGAELHFNDYNEDMGGKREAMAMMAEELNAQWETDPRNTEPGRKLIEGLGLQAHYNVNGLRPEAVEATIQRFIEAGVKVIISELDIPGGSWPDYTPILTEDEEMEQARLYAELFLIYKKYADHISRVTVWGIDDPTSWRSAGDPLLFGEVTDAKYAYYAAADPEGFLAGEYDNIKTENAGESTAVAAEPPVDNPPEVTPSPEGVVSPSPSEPVGEETGTSGWLIYLLIGLGVLVVVCIVIVAVKKKK